MPKPYKVMDLIGVICLKQMIYTLQKVLNGYGTIHKVVHYLSSSRDVMKISKTWSMKYINK